MGASVGVDDEVVYWWNEGVVKVVSSILRV